MTELKQVTAHIDGACSGNPGPGGYGVILISGANEKCISGGTKDTTNNQMELLAACKALEALKEPCEIDIWSDSQYVVKGMTEWITGWLKGGLYGRPNSALWQRLLDAQEKHTVHWHWIKGHSGNLMNERADQLAQYGMYDVIDGRVPSEKFDVKLEWEEPKE
jgi:ribonuclease HI